MDKSKNILTPQLATEYFKVTSGGTLREKAEFWKKIAQKSSPKADFDSLLHMYLQIFHNEKLPIAWLPDEDMTDKSNIGMLIKELNFNSYKELHQWSVNNRNSFWEKTIQKLGIRLKKPYNTLIDLAKGVEDPTWLEGAEMNITESCFQNPDSDIAIISGSENSTELTKVTYGELNKLVNQIASGLIKKGFIAGDKIIIYMPLTIESIAAYLAIIKAGMVVVSVADSFSSNELKKRIEMTGAKAVITCDGYVYGGKTIDIIKKVREADPENIIACRYTGNSQLNDKETAFEAILDSEDFEAHTSAPDTITNILFSSGTTKEPKSIPWTHLTPIKCASDGYYHHDIKKGDIVSWTTGMGWMMAPWLIYATLINKATIAIYTGSPAGAGFGKFAQDAGISILGTIPSVVKAWRQNGFKGKYNWKVRLYSSTGEPSNAEDYLYLMSLTDFKAPVIEYCGGTEIGGGYITGTIVQPASPATFTTPALGTDFYLMDLNFKQSIPGQPGEVFIVPPSIGLTQKLLNRNHHEEYYAGIEKGPKGETLRKHGDAFERLEVLDTCFYKSVGRIDDAMNLGGIKVSAVEIEEVVSKHHSIVEAAAISVPDKNGGPERLIVYYRSNKKEPEASLKKDLQDLISKELNPLFRISEIIKTETLPRTASNKIMRRELRKKYMDAT